MPGPLSSYSSFVTHIEENVESDDRIDPPIQTEYFLSGGATTLIFIALGAKFVTSFDKRSGRPSYIVVPPDSTMLAYKSFLTSMSHFIMDVYTV